MILPDLLHWQLVLLILYDIICRKYLAQALWRSDRGHVDLRCSVDTTTSMVSHRFGARCCIALLGRHRQHRNEQGHVRFGTSSMFRVQHCVPILEHGLLGVASVTATRWLLCLCCLGRRQARHSSSAHIVLWCCCFRVCDVAEDQCTTQMHAKHAFS